MKGNIGPLFPPIKKGDRGPITPVDDCRLKLQTERLQKAKARLAIIKCESVEEDEAGYKVAVVKVRKFVSNVTGAGLR